MRRDTGPTPEVRQLVIERDRFRCVVDGVQVSEWEGYEVHHRSNRGSGGSKRDGVNGPANLILLCRPHHAWITNDHAGVVLAKHHGWVISKFSTPSSIPLNHSLLGRVFLDEDGGYALVEPPEDAA